jgi:hypothetical protein
VLDSDCPRGAYFRLRTIASDGFVDVYDNGLCNVRHAPPATGLVSPAFAG